MATTVLTPKVIKRFNAILGKLGIIKGLGIERR